MDLKYDLHTCIIMENLSLKSILFIKLRELKINLTGQKLVPLFSNSVTVDLTASHIYIFSSLAFKIDGINEVSWSHQNQSKDGLFVQNPLKYNSVAIKLLN